MLPAIMIHSVIWNNEHTEINVKRKTKLILYCQLSLKFPPNSTVTHFREHQNLVN